MSELDKYPLMYEEIKKEELEPDQDPLIQESGKYVPMCEGIITKRGKEAEECPNPATLEWYRHESDDYFYTLRCESHPPAHQHYYEAKPL